MDNVVIIKDDNAPRNRWQLARIVAANQGTDGRIRTVKLVLADAGGVKFSVRPVQKLFLIDVESRGRSQLRSP